MIEDPVIAVTSALATTIVAALVLNRWAKKKPRPRDRNTEPAPATSWFRRSVPYCPCDPLAKGWIERRLEWLSGEFPSNIFTDRPLILPTREFFPDPHDPSKEFAHALLVRVCQFMGVEASHVVLRFHEADRVWIGDGYGNRVPLLFVNDSGDYLPYAAGTYSRSLRRYIITLDTGEFYEPNHLIATMAHELAHARLLGERRIRGHHHDDELLTDLTAFFLGFAIFMANSPRVWTSMFTKWPGTEVNKSEYMTSPMYGYALAHLAWFEGTRKPTWTKYLGSNVINDFRGATKYLFKTGDSAFRPAWMDECTLEKRDGGRGNS